MRSGTRPARTCVRCRCPATRCSGLFARPGSANVQLLRPESVEAAAAALGNGSVALAGGTDLVPLLRDRLVSAETLVELKEVVPRGVHQGGSGIGAGTTLAELEVDPEVPAALREACALAASPQLRSMGTIDRKSTRLNSSHPSISYAVFC